MVSLTCSGQVKQRGMGCQRLFCCPLPQSPTDLGTAEIPSFNFFTQMVGIQTF